MISLDEAVVCGTLPSLYCPVVGPGLVGCKRVADAEAELGAVAAYFAILPTI
ncbi:hypothetical protein [Paenarthrobacter sp. YIM B13468]|uniref:hypothetical protein n=1 Tax=Paenarthrobacter sp. YIM B13468 TaxID=3366295 RepID=UPI00367273E1